MTAIRTNLPLLDRLVGDALDQIGSKSIERIPEAFDPSQIAIVGLQHMVGTTHALVRAFLALGISPSRIRLLGKAYSTDPATLEKIRSEGACVEVSRYLDPTVGYDDTLKADVARFVDESVVAFLEDSALRKIVVLDDGGFMIAEMSRRSSVLYSRDISLCGVEQTTSGFRLISRELATFPIVNVARSSVKLADEADIVTDIVWRTVVHLMGEIGVEARRILIVGKGAIGSSLGGLAAGHCHVDYFDTDPEKLAGAQTALAEIVPRYDLVVGCVGSTVIDLSALADPDKLVVFASASSSDVEFRAEKFRALAGSGPDHREHARRGNILLLNSGFPINFHFVGVIEEPAIFQLTRALLFAGVVQACGLDAAAPGIVALDDRQIDRYVKEGMIV